MTLGRPTIDSSPSARIPLLVGVTGHRDLRDQDVAALEKALDQLFDNFHQRFPNTPITLISQLAEGADRLAARVARRRGMKIVALLPMPREMYEADFKTEVSQREFSEMLGWAESTIELAPPDHLPADEFARDGESRNSRYAAAGAEVNRRVHLLLALWDGEPAVGPGGTGQIVEFMTKGPSPEFREVDDFLHFSRVGPVAHIWTPRKRGTGTSTPAGQLEWLGPEGSRGSIAEKAFYREAGQIERFNFDALATEESGDSLIPASARCANAQGAEVKYLDDVFRASDSIARKFQSLARRAFIFTAVAGMAVLSFYELNVHYHTHRPLFMVLFLACMVISLALYLLVWKPGTHQRYLDYRSLAEALRVQYFWSLGGTGAKAIEHLTPRLREELQWLRLALLGCGGAGETPLASIESLRCVQQYWVRDQRGYFQKQSISQRKKVEWNSAYKTALVVSGLVLLVMTMLLKGAHQPGEIISGRESLVGTLQVMLLGFGAFLVVYGIKRLRVQEEYRGIPKAFVGMGAAAIVGMLVLIFRSEHPVQSAAFLASAILSVLCAVAAGILELHGEHFAFKEHARRYRTMADLFTRADEALEPLLIRSDIPEAHRLLIELGRESLAENAEWFALHRERPIKLLKPG